MSVPRRTIDELISTHQYERNIIDIYVEGALDADLFRWYLEERGFRHVQVYEIDAIDVSVAALGVQTPGQRQRVIALAEAIDGKVAPAKISCVCDRDFEDWMPTPDLHRWRVLLTDFISIDCYCLDVSLVDKFLRLVIGERRIKGVDVLQELEPILEECFLIRLAHQMLGWELCWITQERCCKISKTGKITFDRNTFLRRLLQKNNHSKDEALLEREILRLRQTLPSDLRMKIHGHDFALLLSWYIAKVSNTRTKTDGEIIRTLMACLHVDNLFGFPLFQEIERRIAIR